MLNIFFISVISTLILLSIGSIVDYIDSEHIASNRDWVQKGEFRHFKGYDFISTIIVIAFWVSFSVVVVSSIYLLISCI